MSPIYSPPGGAAHAATHLPAGTDAIDWTSGINRTGLDASRPAAASTNAGERYWATDTGVVYRSTGAAWGVEMFDNEFPLIKNGGSAYRENYERMNITNNGTDTVASGVMGHTALPLIAGDVVTNLTFCSGGQAVVTPTNWWFALYSSAATPALLSQTADQTSTALGTFTGVTLALGAPQTITITGLYYAAFMFAAATPASLMWRGGGPSNVVCTQGVFGTQKRLSGFSGSGLTTTAPATITGLTQLFPYVWCAAS